MATRLDQDAWVLKAIVALRDTERSKGIHVVFSGFNNALRRKFDADPVAVINDCAKRGIIDMQLRKRGPMIYLPGEGPTRNNNNPAAADKTVKAVDSYKE